MHAVEAWQKQAERWLTGSDKQEVHAVEASQKQAERWLIGSDKQEVHAVEDYQKPVQRWLPAVSVKDAAERNRMTLQV